MKKAFMYGAGNIGRGFIGALFSASGYETVFCDINAEVVGGINNHGCYPLYVIARDRRTGDEKYEVATVGSVRAVHGGNVENVATEIAEADVASTAVGVNVLPHISKTIALGIKKRYRGSRKPLDFIVCENMIGADLYLRSLVYEGLSCDEKAWADGNIGFAEASVGRMVPPVPDEIKKQNSLAVCVEAYDHLPVDRDAFKGSVPDIVNLEPSSHFDFYIKRKLFIHNMGHAVAAYYGSRKGYAYIWEAMGDSGVAGCTRAAMSEAAAALSKIYGGLVPASSAAELSGHIDDLLWRFGSRLLGDTVARVGADPKRKAARNDRLAGAALMCESLGLPYGNICTGLALAYKYDAAADISAAELQEYVGRHGIGAALKEYSGLDIRSGVYETCVDLYNKI